MSIQRYHLAAPDAVQTMAGMAPHAAGAWVRYDDHVAEVERLTDHSRQLEEDNP